MKKILLFLFLFSAFFTHAQETEYSFSRHFNTSGTIKFDISTVDSDVQISSIPGNELIVYFTIRKGRQLMELTQQELDRYYQLEINENNDNYSIKVRPRNKLNWRISWKDRISLSIEVQTPRQTSCHISAVDADLSLQKLNGNQSCTTVDGDLSLTAINGLIKIATTDGDITASHINGSFTAGTTDGDVNLSQIKGNTKISAVDGDISVSEHSEGNLSVSTVDGDIRFDHTNGEIYCKTIDGDISGSIDQLQNSCSCYTSDGDIDVNLPNTGLNLDLVGDDIGPHLVGQFNGTIEKHKVFGQYKGGGKAVLLHSSGGDVTLRFN